MFNTPATHHEDTLSDAVACPLPSATRQQKRRGISWIAGSFLFCPCHLPVTLGLLAFLLGGTAFGALLRSYGLLAGAIITIVWALGTWRGIVHLRAARTCSTCAIQAADAAEGV